MQKHRNRVPFLLGMCVGGAAGLLFLAVYWLTVLNKLF